MLHGRPQDKAGREQKRYGISSASVHHVWAMIAGKLCLRGKAA
jgi:hypothetical protein